MTTYCSFLVIDPRYHDVVVSTSQPDAWKVDLVTDPSRRFWFSPNGSRSIDHPDAINEPPRDDERPGLLLTLSTDEAEAVAQNLLDLVCASYDVLEGDPTRMLGYKPAFEYSVGDAATEKNVFRTPGFFDQFAHRHELPVALRIAAQAWGDQSLTYALHKLATSLNTESITWWSAAPEYGQVFERTTARHAQHVRSSMAVNLAFSAIEELQLQVKSSSKDPRWLDNESGAWNPKVLQDLEQRLRNAGIDPGHTVTWTVRGGPSLAETELKPTLGRPAPYAAADVVRDIELTLPEALHVCSFLRNYMTAHRFCESSASIGPYEVHNVQSVARHVVLAASGYWKTWSANLPLDGG